MAERRPWRALAIVSVLVLVLVGAGAWWFSRDEEDTSVECPSERATMRALARADDGARMATALDDGLRAFLCAHPDADDLAARAWAQQVAQVVSGAADSRVVQPPWAAIRRLVTRPWKKVDGPPLRLGPESRVGSPRLRVLEYLSDRPGPWGPSKAISVGPDRLLFALEAEPYGPAKKLQLFERIDGRWKRQPFGPSDAAELAWVDPEAGYAVFSGGVGQDRTALVYDLTHPSTSPVVTREHVASVAWDPHDGRLQLLRWYAATHERGEVPLTYDWTLDRRDGAVTSQEKLATEHRKLLFDLLTAPREQREFATRDPDSAAALLLLHREDLGQEWNDEPAGEAARRFGVRCDALCAPKDTCSIVIDRTPEGPHVSFADLPPGCVISDAVRSPEASRVKPPPNGRVLLAGLEAPSALAPDGHDWLVLSDGVLRRVPGQGGAFKVLLDLKFGDSDACGGHRLVVGGSSAAPVEVALNGRHPFSIPLAGGGWRTIVGEKVAAVGADGEAAYVLDDGSLRRVPFDDNVPATLTSALSQAHAVAIADGAAWILDRDPATATPRLVRVPVEGGRPEPVTTGESEGTHLDTDGASLYWARQDGSLRALDARTRKTQLLVEPGGATISALAVGARDVYFSVGVTVPCPADPTRKCDATTIRRVPKAGGPAVDVVRDQASACGLAVSGDSLAWTTGGLFVTVPLGGKPFDVQPALVTTTE